MSSDEDLVMSVCQQNRRDALDELVRRHLGAVRGLAFQMLLDHDAADDVAQDVFLRVIRGLHAFRADAKFSTWLYRIAMNCIYTALRKQNRRPTPDQEVLVDRAVSPSTTPEGVAIGLELGVRIQAALAELSPKLRAAIVLTCIQEKSGEEAAEIEGCTASTIYWRVHEARKLLQRRLGDEQDG